MNLETYHLGISCCWLPCCALWHSSFPAVILKSKPLPCLSLVVAQHYICHMWVRSRCSWVINLCSHSPHLSVIMFTAVCWCAFQDTERERFVDMHQLQVLLLPWSDLFFLAISGIKSSDYYSNILCHAMAGGGWVGGGCFLYLVLNF